MANEMVKFNFEGNAVRTVDRDGDIWFVAKDVADSLNFRDAHNAIRTLDPDEKGTHIVSTLGGKQEMTVVNESGLYHLIFKSRKPVAAMFRRWVTMEVLPAIRKMGSYSVSPQSTVRSQQEVGTVLMREIETERRELLREVDERERVLTFLRKRSGIKNPYPVPIIRNNGYAQTGTEIHKQLETAIQENTEMHPTSLAIKNIIQATPGYDVKTLVDDLNGDNASEVLLSPKEMAEYCSVTIRTVGKWVKLYPECTKKLRGNRRICRDRMLAVLEKSQS